MTSDYVIAGDHNIPIVVFPLGKFIRCLPVGFHRGSDGKMHHDPDRVNLFLDKGVRKIFANAYTKTVKVNNAEEFATMKQRLLTLPIFLSVTLEARYIQCFIVLRKTTITTANVMVCITPSHPVIKAQLEQQFAECEQLLSEGKKFSLEIKVGEIMKDWYAQIRDPPCASIALYNSEGSTLCVTNFRQRCSMCYHPLVWCIPVTWVLGPPYLIYRAVKCNDVKTELCAIVTFIEDGPRIIVQNAPQVTPRNPQYPPPYTDHPQPNPNSQKQMTPYNNPIQSNPNAPTARGETAEEFQNVQSQEDDEPLIVA